MVWNYYWYSINNYNYGNICFIYEEVNIRKMKKERKIRVSKIRKSLIESKGYEQFTTNQTMRVINQIAEDLRIKLE